MRPSRWLSILLIGTALCAMDLSDIYAQRGGGGRGGGGRGGGGGGGGRGDLRPQQRGQFNDFPWDAQKLLEGQRADSQSNASPHTDVHTRSGQKMG